MSDLTKFCPEAEQIATERFGYEALRPHQKEVLEHLYRGDDCLAIMPTGSGKSLCYTIPALTRPGLVLVISPLVALIRDQYRKLKERDIPCSFLDSLQSRNERREHLSRLESGESKILIVSPERLARVDFRKRMKSHDIQFVAIDEAHCISQWGHHFRREYQMLGTYLADLDIKQKLALTATATRKVRNDILGSLDMESSEIVWTDFSRDNLQLRFTKSKKVPEQMNLLLQSVLSQTGAGIIYATTRKSATEVARMLYNAGESVALYHGGLSSDQRQNAQKKFIEGSARVIVATNAFGMGIDKSDIRFVFHAGLPGSIEQYIQEIGRAGRDGKDALCWMIYSSRDYHIQKFMLDKSYPPLSLLEDVASSVTPILDGPQSVYENTLISDLSESIDAKRADIAGAIEILAREGILNRLRPTGAWGRDAASQPLMELGNFRGLPKFFEMYPERKNQSLGKLNAMKEFAILESTQDQFLQAYFRQ
jgi:ATP-dependent DNA helicase RecQ